MNKGEYLLGTGKVGYQHSSRYCSLLKESCTVHFAFCIVHREWTVHCALCIVHCALGIALCTVLCAFCIVHCALCIVRCAVGSHFGSMPGCTRVHVHCAFGIVQCASFIVRCAVCGNSAKTVPLHCCRDLRACPVLLEQRPTPATRTQWLIGSVYQGLIRSL